MSDELWFPNEFAECYQIDIADKKQENGCRVFGIKKSGAVVQIRTFKPTNQFHNGKPRKMIAHCFLGKEQLKQIIEAVENAEY